MTVLQRYNTQQKTSYIKSKLPIIVLILFSFGFNSCSQSTNKNEETEIRIVDLNGNPKPIRRVIPQGNLEMMITRGKEATNDRPEINSQNTQNFRNQLTQKQEAQREEIKNLPVENQLTQKQEIKSQANKNITKKFKLINSSGSESSKKLTESQQTADKNIKQKFYLVSPNQDKAQEKTEQTNPKEIFIQIGSFFSYQDSQQALQKSKEIGQSIIKNTKINGQKLYLVLIIANQNNYSQILEQAKTLGFKNAFIIK